MLRYPSVQSLKIAASATGREYSIRVMLPLTAANDQRRFPVLYMTDANAYFEACRSLSYNLQLLPGVPPYILVGIGYAGDAPCAGQLLRARDLTFEGYPRFDLSAPALEGVLTAPAGEPAFGQGHAFLEFIASDLVPQIDDAFPALPGERTYFGHSAGAGFGLYALAERPELFMRLILSSPGLVFDGRSSAGIDYERHDAVLWRVRKLLTSGFNPGTRKIYCSAGAEEDSEADIVPWRIAGNLPKLAHLFDAANHPQQTFKAEILPGEFHCTAWALAFMRGVQFVFRS